MLATSTMTDSLITPATKLSQLFQEAYKIDGKIVISEVWKTVLKFDPERDRTIENKYLMMLQLFQYTKNDLDELATLGIKIEKYADAIDTILTGLFYCSINNSWSQFISKVNISNISLLESCGETLIFYKKGVKEISREDVYDTLASIESLISEVKDSDIDEKIKRTLIDKLNRIYKSLQDSQVFGAIFFQKATNEAFTETVDIINNVDKSSWSETATSKVKDVVNFLYKCVTIYSCVEKIHPQLKPLVESLVHLLPPSH
jgi:hypothetical protein